MIVKEEVFIEDSLSSFNLKKWLQYNGFSG